MDIIRRNTDYALRIAVYLAQVYEKGTFVSSKTVSKQQDVPYALTSKLLQKMQKMDLVYSVMGSKGGFRLAKNPADISFLKIIETVQGPVSVNRCLIGDYKCPLRKHCPLHSKFTGLQKQIRDSLNETQLSDVMNKNDPV